MDTFADIDFNLEDFDTNQLLKLVDEPLKKPIITIVPDDIYSKNNYDKRTCIYYKTMRLRKMDPLVNLDLDENKAFIFEDIWDPITGERIQKDPNGGLYFDPDTLIHYYYINRLKNLWSEPEDNAEGYFEGYYDFGVGAGENIHVIGRGYCPDKYLLRLPIIDCYLTKDHNDSFVTMGPVLSLEEIKIIDDKASKLPDNYKKLFGKPRPKLEDIKKYYDNALNNNPDISTLKSKYPNKTDEELICLFNREAVESLKKL